MASRFTVGSRLGPLGTAQLFITPSSSRRKSKWRWLAACFWMTKRSLLRALSSRADDGSLPDGSAVREKSRLRLYSASFSRADDARVDGARFLEPDDGFADSFFDDFRAAATGAQR